MVRGEALSDIQGPVRTAVLNDDDLGGIFLGGEKSKYLLQRSGQAGFFVVSRDDDA
jgi:hypothetical protein